MSKTVEPVYVQVPVIRLGKGVNIVASLEKAKELIEKYSEEDSQASEAVASVVDEILANEKYAEMKRFDAATLARLALAKLDEMPTEKVCKETAERVSAYLSDQPETFLHIKAGRNAGFHCIERYTKDELAKLQKTAPTEASK